MRTGVQTPASAASGGLRQVSQVRGEPSGSHGVHVARPSSRQATVSPGGHRGRCLALGGML